ncbi:MAG: Uma2 family endonuclease [Actinomycetota bacterium]
MPATKLTYAELSELPDDGLRHELLDGELVMTAAPSFRHQTITVRLVRAFEDFFDEHGGGQALIAPLDVKFSDHDVLEPDVVVVLADRYNTRTDRGIFGVPSLVIEVVSDSRYDRVRKRERYAHFGVPQYWVVDPESDRVEVYRLIEPGHYAKPEIFEPGDTLRYEPLKDFTLDISELMEPEFRDR